VSDTAPVADTAETWCIFGQHYPRAFGGGIPSFVSELMEEDGRFSTGLARLQLLFLQRGEYVPFHHSDGRIVQDGSDGQRDRWEQRFSSLPKRRIERQKRWLSLELRGDPRLDYRDSVYLTNITREDVRIGAEMVRDALTYVQSTLKRADGVDLTAMIAAAASLAQRGWPSDEALRESCRRAYDLDRARINAMDPWSTIDMHGFHPEARKVLDHPSDWSQSNDFSPHGNDVGADILASWSRLKNKSVSALAQYFEIDLESDDAEASMARIQMSQALAFGHIKKSGSCPKDLALLALQILRTDAEKAAALVGPGHFAAWQAACSRYRSILEREAAK
jgi:uncharacterized protein YfeS